MGVHTLRWVLLVVCGSLLIGGCESAEDMGGGLGTVGSERSVVEQSGAEEDANAPASADQAMEAGSQCLVDSDCAGRVDPAIVPCLLSVCDSDTGQCVLGPKKDATPCDDGDSCSQHTTCLDGECRGGIHMECDDQNPCTDDVCDPHEGCRHIDNTLPCDDGNACTLEDTCLNGECHGLGSSSCACAVDADCLELDDGNLCNGSPKCVLGQCQTIAEDGVVCSGTDESGCQKMACEPTTGECVAQNTADGTPCHDGNPCTEGDLCEAGACVPGQGACPCATSTDCEPFQDDNLCNGVLTCIEGTCAIAADSVVVCPTAGPSGCTQMVCNEGTGLCDPTPRPDGTPCEDGSACTSDNQCEAGVCLGQLLNCDDKNPCTTESCQPEEGCVYEIVYGPCDDGNICTLNDQCVEDACVGSAIECADEDPCTTDSCDEALGCINVTHDGPCDDMNPCTADDICFEGACMGVPVFCDDEIPCTKDSCDTQLGCIHVPEDALCTDKTACIVGVCDLVDGCLPEVAGDGSACDDLDPCTTNEVCLSGACQGVPYPGPGCTTESCGNGICASTEDCTSCPTDCGPCTDTGNCCDKQTTAGCNDAMVESCVCALNPLCCETFWDEVCVSLAETDCGAGCGIIQPGQCGDGVCDSMEDCTTCPGDCGPCELSECCTPQDLPGCVEPAIESCVCGADPFCCAMDELGIGSWDSICIDEAVNECGLACDDNLPDLCGDDICAPNEDCASCPLDCGTCATTNCCEAQVTPGCTDSAIQACVCDMDSFCCGTAWDSFCVQQADTDCGANCQTCGDGTCSFTETCLTCELDCGACPTNDTCCETTAFPGCGDLVLEQCVCAIDAYCCDTAWDSICVGEVDTDCGGNCSGTVEPPQPVCGDALCDATEDCDICPADCGPCEVKGDCCEPQITGGCDDPIMESCLCVEEPAPDAFCCNTSWDAVCVQMAKDKCALDCGDEPPATWCGDGSCNATESCEDCPQDCDECPPLPGEDCCTTHANPGCSDLVISTCVCEKEPGCCTLAWFDFCTEVAKIDCKAPCGVEPGTCGDGVCDDDETCTDCASDCGFCPGTGDCCEAKGFEFWGTDEGPGCEDEEIQSCVCDLAPFCCETIWDVGCVAEAEKKCGAECNLPEPSFCGDSVCDADEDCFNCQQDCGSCGEGACCEKHLTPGCEDMAVQNCVCEEDDYCCLNKWDSYCIDLATEDCGLECDDGNDGCGDGQCLEGEDCEICPEDCGPCVDPDKGSCCVTHPTPGCNDSVVQGCVCATDPFCCFSEWNELCTLQAQKQCKAVCDDLPASCGDGVCASDESCDTCATDCGPCVGSCGDGICELGESCKSCETDCGPCIATCGDGVCEGTESCDTCAQDCGGCGPVCGDTQCGPGESCESCPIDCGQCTATCGDGVCSLDETCTNCATDCGSCNKSSCCEAGNAGEPGCDDTACETVVCSLDSYCCETDWDSSCVNCATTGVGFSSMDCSLALPACNVCHWCGNGQCTPSNGEDCMSCQADCGACESDWCGNGQCTPLTGEDCLTCEADCGPCTGTPGSDCCAGKTEPGCSNSSCQNLVCALDAYCCTGSWDTYCAACAQGQPGYGGIDCSSTIATCAECSSF